MLSSNGYFTNSALIGLVLGQLVSLLVTSTGLFSSELSRRGIDAPTSQSFLNYLLLGIIYGGIVLYRRRPLQMKWYYYLMLGLVDVEANYLVVKAYQYTSMTSVMLLDCWSIPCVIILTAVFLKTRYQIRKFIGVAICIVGLVLVIFSDVHAGDRAGGRAPVKGDVLVIVGATLYAISNVSEEFVVKSADRIELMAMLGLFGAVVSACQIIIFERTELQSVHWTKDAVAPFLGFAAAMFLFYSTVPVLLKISGSTMLNLSLLTSDMWAILIRVFAYYEEVDWIYYVAFVAVAFGLVIYSSGKKEDETTFHVSADDVEGKARDQVTIPDRLEERGAYQALTSEEQL
ncbi:solute carrier family 35 protein (DUF914) [Rhynchospora pubera]|uniref:Solute carrier family 35 protein (DUF914) n=1 Tax=Rhynchospora pubera TaxID=906938 RepID=A0AAV8C0K5_9POAL|nr:solute carrier family 35 protein (DUF914) [Rhynchospora pubera]